MTNRALSLSLLVPAVLLAAVGAAAAEFVPPEVAERLSAAGLLSETDDFVGTFTVTTESVIQMQAVTAPGPLKELDMRMEFARLGDGIYMSRMVTSGSAKVLLFTREFEANFRISDVKAAGPGPD